MAHPRSEGRPSNKPFDRKQADGEDAVKGRRDPGVNGHAHDESRGKKRKSYDTRPNDERSKRQHTRSVSPEMSDRRAAAGPAKSREPPRGPRVHANGSGPHRGGGRIASQSDHMGHDGDEMAVDRKPRQQYQQPSRRPEAGDPIKRMSAGWIPDIEIEDDDEALHEVKRIMGFAGFKSSKNRKVPGNDKNYAVRKKEETRARQYMNRAGGFNRPLSPSRN